MIKLARRAIRIKYNVHGAFVEPIRTIVYDSIYDPSSPLADENGFRKNIIQLIRELKIPVVRWPGGNNVSGYNWEVGFYHYIFTTSCFLIKSLSILTPIPGPVGTLIFPSMTFNGDVGHSNITVVSSPLNS